MAAFSARAAAGKSFQNRPVVADSMLSMVLKVGPAVLASIQNNSGQPQGLVGPSAAG